MKGPLPTSASSWRTAGRDSASARSSSRKSFVRESSAASISSAPTCSRKIAARCACSPGTRRSRGGRWPAASPASCSVAVRTLPSRPRDTEAPSMRLAVLGSGGIGKRPSAGDRGTERSCRSARPEARRPDTDPSDNRRVPSGSSAIRINETTLSPALGNAGLSRRDSHSPGRKEQSMDAQVRSTDAVMSNGIGVRTDVGSRPEDAPPAARAQRFDPRTRVLLEGPITSTLLRLATPNVLVMLMQASVGLIETYFVGKLGTDALAGVALVFPALMLMQMMSAGAMGGGISAAIARALGAGRRADADALAVHALAIAVGFGLLFMLAVLGGGHWLYSAMGGSGASLTAALTYSNVLFSGAILIWVFNSLASVIRGSGNMAVPAVVTAVGAAALIPLSPCLIFGWGPFPRLGIAGGALAIIAYYVVRSIALIAYLRARHSVVHLLFSGVRFRWPLFRDILRVGAVAALVTIQTNLTIAIATGFVGRFGPAAIAGYGTGSRLEYLLIPLVFGLGGPLVAMVGTNIGAGQRDRALRAAWIGAGIAAGLTEVIGLSAAAFPHAWLSLFDTDPVMLDAGSRYLYAVGPFLEGFAVGQPFAPGRVRTDKERIKTVGAEFAPQSFHPDEEAARDTIFRGLAASGCHPPAAPMRLLVESALNPAGGIVGAGA